MAKGWFQTPQRPEGDRSIEEQMIGIPPALGEAKGKAVLDLGCAEGCIAKEFALAGAREVLAIEALEEHLKVARAYCSGLMNVHFVCALLQNYMLQNKPSGQFDIVLMLGIAHKLHDPEPFVRWAARNSRDLLLFRGPGREALKGWDGRIRSKHENKWVNIPETMSAEGFVLEKQIDGVRGEGVHYWRRARRP